MNIRVIRYFIATVRAQSISAAAQLLHVTQPTLSRQFMELEEELGHKLFERTNRKIKLTAKGELFYARALEIVELFDRTKMEVSADEEPLGSITIAAGETPVMRLIGRVIKQFHLKVPKVQCNVISGSELDISAGLRNGTTDIGLFIGTVNLSDYDYIKLPEKDRWGLLTTIDGPLSDKECITVNDITQVPLLCSRQALNNNEFTGWLGSAVNDLRIVGTFNLIYNAALLAEEGFGHVLSLEGIYTPGEQSNLKFIPLAPELEADVIAAWPKDRKISRATEIFLDILRTEMKNYRNTSSKIA